MDRQDIDALLIGALYGELTPAEEARLATHLESHPTDRGALDDLKTARQAVRESRIFELQVDPPQHLSALLLQEAHRRAPKRVVADEAKESWFSRFMRSFAAHPAMAAAAMLVLVLGVAGTLYMKKGADFATKEYAAEPAEAEHKPEVAAAPTGTAEEQAEGAAAGSAAPAPAEAASATDQYQAGLYDKNSAGDSSRRRDEASKRQLGAQREVAKAEKADSAADRGASKDLAKEAAPQKKSAVSNGIIVGTASPDPKDFESDNVVGGAKGNTFSLDGADDSVARNSNTRAGVGGGANAPGTGAATTSTGTSSYAKTPPATTTPSRNAAPYAQPPPPPPSGPAQDNAAVAQAPTTKTAPKTAEKPTDAKVATKAAPAPAQDATPDSTLLAWAKGEHDAVKALVRKGDCTTAAKRALGVSNRAPDYFAANMASDRDLKSCMAYINSERDKDAEKSGKARAQKRVNADEVQSAPAPAK